MSRSFLVVRSKDASDATVRLQSDAVLDGLSSLPDISAQLVDPSQQIQIDKGSCLLFHFDDLPAMAALKEFRRRGDNFLAACFGCDIYDFSRYLASYEVADLYLMPTAMHRNVLASQFSKPVYYLPEGIDPIAVGDSGPTSFEIKRASRLLWFGYSLSFNKGMASLIPVLKQHLQSGRLSSFSLILDESEFSNDFHLPTIPYRGESFRANTRDFDYCILSHFSLDLCLNSYIKSPNKLITALMAGLIPIASNTPSYADLLREFRLDNFLFDSPACLDRMLNNLDPARDSQQIIDSGIVEALRTRFSGTSIANELLAILAKYEQRSENEFTAFQPSILPPKQTPVYFTQHLKDLLPSFWRAIQNRRSRPDRHPER